MKCFYFYKTATHLIVLTVLILSVLHCAIVSAEELDSAEIMLGERLFIETRFAQYFKSSLDQGGSVNDPIPKGDPTLNKTIRFFGLPPYQIPFVDGPYSGQTFNCRTCHLVDEHLEQKELGMRAYADFASRSPLPTRDDGQFNTVRNAPAPVHASIPRKNLIMHFDGEFYSLRQLVRGTLTNRNFGWLPGEKDIAINHICKIVREDNGKNVLAAEFGDLSYSEAFSGATKDNNPVASDYQIPKVLQTDIHKDSCEHVFDTVANFIAIYTESLVFAADETIFSPYDLFLRTNKLPTQPNSDESDIDYSKRLMAEIKALKNKNSLKFTTKNPNTEHGGFEFHDLAFQFSELELKGMEIFFNQNEKDHIQKGNCIACHPAPNFTDFGLHNTGVTQIEYQAIHGNNAFNKLAIPSLSQRNEQPDQHLPATHQHPNRQSQFRRIPDKSTPLFTDLGAWNVFHNDDYPKTQDRIENLICKSDDTCTSDEHALALSIATFKTPSLRDLGHSAHICTTAYSATCMQR